VEPESLSYKSGDAFLAAAPGKTNQTLVFLDSTGRTYSVGAHTLPSARSQGEPLTGKVSPPDGAHFAGLLFGEPGRHCILGSDKGYGFVTRLEDVAARTRGGKAALTVPKGAAVLPPLMTTETADDELAVVSREGRLLVLPVSALPELARGKGNKLIQVRGEDAVAAWCVVAQDASLVLGSGRRTLTLKSADLEPYRGDRGQRGRNLPRGFQRVHLARSGEN
jgi:topoisomerase-4 subunit A